MASGLYAFSAMVAFVVELFLLRQHNKLGMTDKASRTYDVTMACSVIFCAVDCLWGLCAAGIIVSNERLFTLLSFFFHFFACVVSYMWYRYIVAYLEFDMPMWLQVIVTLPVAAAMAVLFSNHYLHQVFYIDENTVYQPGPLRYGLFALEVFYLVLGIFRTLIRLFTVKDKFKRARFNMVLTFLSVYIAFLAIQYLFSNAPAFTAGVMVSSLVIFVGNIAMDREQKYRAVSEQYKNESQETYSALATLSNSFVSIHLINLELDKLVKVKSTPEIDAYADPEKPASEQIVDVMNGVSVPESTKGIVDFVNLHMLPARMVNRDILTYEFEGKQCGWCISSFMVVERDEDGVPVKVIHAVQSIDEQKRSQMAYEEELRAALENKNVIFAEMLKMQSGGVLAAEMDGKIIMVNDAVAKMFGYKDASMIKGSFDEIMADAEIEDKENVMKNYQRAINKDGAFTFFFSIQRGKGRIMHVQASARVTELKNKKRIMLTSFTDITSSREAQERFRLLSETDPLTGINNRGSGEGKTALALEHGAQGMLCIMDVNNFKHINDTYGHRAGDRALIAIAEALISSFRDRDVVMRLGGDEFAVFAQNITNKAIAIECLRRFIERVDGISLDEMNGERITVSIGAVFTDKDSDKDFSEYYNLADSVMYLCKEHKNESTFEFYKAENI